MQSLQIQRNPIRDQKTVLLFINQIKQHPCLWKQSDDYYRNINARKVAWCTIARKMGHSVSVLRSKWRSLTVHYFKLRDDIELRRNAQNQGGPNWFAYCSMEFLGNSKNVRQRRGQHKEYLILGEEQNIVPEECELNEIVHVEEESENYEATMEDNLAESTTVCTVSYDVTNGNLPQGTLLEEEQNNADDGMADSEISLEQRYVNEKRKSMLLYQLNERLEKQLQQQRAEVQLQQQKMLSLEQKLKFSERKLAKLTKIHQENFDTIVSDDDTTETLVDGTTFTINVATDANGQCDPLYNPTETINRGSSSDPIQLMSSSIKKMQTVIESFTNQSKRRYSGFGEFMVRELNDMDETTSLRLIKDMISILQREGNVHRNTRTHVE
ncbi:uncharacterized protein LOC128714951 [Anopheles marshallii]|uniref:uncharacterized protein LOC128714951 n=1 Tax=Anopheles marshallii TaxID=1521116 RepID=UPI00237AD676|nr:uncharacterized protein LOC128714951 [Anopheles marshallii]